jgi:hypothetical protein
MSGNFYRILGARIVYIGSCPILFYPLSTSLNKFFKLFRVQRTRTFIEKAIKNVLRVQRTRTFMSEPMCESAGLGEYFFSLFL